MSLHSIKDPFSMWLLYIVIFAFMAFIGATTIAYYFLIGSGSIILSLLFGFWSGMKSYKSKLHVAIFNGFVLGLAIGFITLLLIVGISALSKAFLSLIATSVAGTLPIGIGAWSFITMLSALGSALGSEFKAIR